MTYTHLANCRCMLMHSWNDWGWSLEPVSPAKHELNLARSKLAWAAAAMTHKPGTLLIPTREEYIGLIAMIRDGEA